MKLITKETAIALMAAYQHSAETGESGKQVLAKYFTPWANATWYITEGMPVNDAGEALGIVDGAIASNDADAHDWHLYGFCDLGDPPWPSWAM